jgi:hypothetical protein
VKRWSKALAGLAVAVAGGALAVAVFGSPFDGGGDTSRGRQRAVADTHRLIAATGSAPGSYHVTGTTRVAPGVWRVEVATSAPGKPTERHGCFTIQLDRFAVHREGRGRVSLSGVSADPRKCPS